MRQRILFICASMLFASLTLPTMAMAVNDCAVFNRNLKLGMSGEDVRQLQKLLNQDSRTTIASTGSGSSGNESNYFGNKTKLAVIKFQELHASEVLTPAGLLHGNGFIGTLTRAKLTALCAPKPVATPVAASTTASQKPSEKTPSTTPAQLTEMIAPPASTVTSTSTSTKKIPPYIMFPASYAVHQGQKLTIFGGGFTPTNNTIIVGDTQFSGISQKSNSIEVLIPSTQTKGKFTLSFKNANGESNKTFIVITDPNAIAPTIDHFTPTTGTDGTQVTITGTQFSREWNDIVVGSKIITGVVSPDGTTLTFTAQLPIPGVSAGQDVSGVNVSAPLWFYVVNPNGVTGSAVFTLTI